ncbi:hypothetical protein NQD34_004977 [Periophthalmus magnuspinnatus]|nr:hypothetical protein NQD34_004977 [Periophthalmus magnuspinnatus]
MKLVCVVCLIHVSLQLKCDRTQITVHVGGEFVLCCTYNTDNFLFSKKYWCRGSSHRTCEVLADSETKTRQRWTVADATRRGLFIKVTGLRFEDAGMYWVGIDKIYADVMTSIEIVVTEVPVSKPAIRPISPVVGRPSCWGEPVTMRCGSNRGTNVVYVWYQQTRPTISLVSESHDLRLHCRLAQTDSPFYCVARNSVRQEQSDPMYVQVLRAAESNCIYEVKIQGKSLYDCADRLTTTPPTTTSVPTTSTTVNSSSSPVSTVNQNQTLQREIQSWPRTPWIPYYRVLRLSLMAFMLIFLLLVVRCTKSKRRVSRVRRRQRSTQCP